jgi:hypothetical protein
MAPKLAFWRTIGPRAFLVVRQGMSILAADIGQDSHLVKTRVQGFGQSVNRTLAKEKGKVL